MLGSWGDATACGVKQLEDVCSTVVRLCSCCFLCASPSPVRSTAGGWWVAVRGRSPPTRRQSRGCLGACLPCPGGGLAAPAARAGVTVRPCRCAPPSAGDSALRRPPTLPVRWGPPARWSPLTYSWTAAPLRLWFGEAGPLWESYAVRSRRCSPEEYPGVRAHDRYSSCTVGMEGALLILAKAADHTACCWGGMRQPVGEARSCWTPAGTVSRLMTRAAVLTGRARGLPSLPGCRASWGLRPVPAPPPGPGSGRLRRRSARARRGQLRVPTAFLIQTTGPRRAA